MTNDEKQHFWDADVPSIEDEIQAHFKDGKGWRTIVDPKLPQRIGALKKK